jgi:hypothetical protein
MTSKKPTSDEQFGVLEEGDESFPSELSQLFDNHGFRIIDPDNPDEVEDFDG